MADPASQSSFSQSGDVPFSVAGAVMEHATIGQSIVIKGDVSGSEALFIEGKVEGSIHIPEHRVTVGRSSHLSADIYAQDVVVMGSVKGNIHATDLLDIRTDSHIQGELTAQRIRIDDGAVLKGSVEIHSAKRKAEEFEVAARPQPEAAKVEVTASAKKENKVAAAAAVHSARRVPGSSTLLELENR